MSRFTMSVLTLMFLVGAGCMSVSFRGGEDTNQLPMRENKSNVKYKINTINFDVPLMPINAVSWFAERYQGTSPDFMSILQNATQYEKRWICEEVVKRFPELFTLESSGLPVNVRVVSLEDDDEWDNVGFSLCTLTLIPMCRDQANRYEVVLSDGRINQEVCAVSGVMETSFYRSMLIGAWFCGDDSRGFKLCQSYNNLEWLEPYGWGLLGGLSFSSRGRECMKDVFIETFAFDLAKAVIDWENQKKEVKEFRNNKKGN